MACRDEFNVCLSGSQAYSSPTKHDNRGDHKVYLVVLTGLRAEQTWRRDDHVVQLSRCHSTRVVTRRVCVQLALAKQLTACLMLYSEIVCPQSFVVP